MCPVANPALRNGMLLGHRRIGFQEKLERGYLPNPNRKCCTTSFSLHLPTVCLSCSALTLLCLLAHCWRTWLASLTPSSEETFSFLGEKDTGDRMATQCRSWSKAFPERQGKAHPEPSMTLEQLCRFFKFKGEGKKTTSFKNLPSPKSSLLLMSRGVSN